MRIRHMLPLLLMLLLLTGCAQDPLTPLTVTDAELPAPMEEDLPLTQSASTLWFRFLDEPCLVAESRLIETTPAISYEEALLTALVDGPSAASTELNSLFPQGTRVLSTHQQGRMLFVTLSREIMNGFADEPDAWQGDEAWAVEVPLRRELAMQSIAATVTENCDVDTVVILVEQDGAATDSLRLRQGYYRTGGDSMAIAPALTRQEEPLLTPRRTAEIILQCWQERDFVRLYRYTARTDPMDGAARPSQDEFTARMASLPHLMQAQLSGGSVNAQGSQAVFSLEVTYASDGLALAPEALTLRLQRIGGVWRIGMSQLEARKEAAP